METVYNQDKSEFGLVLQLGGTRDENLEKIEELLYKDWTGFFI